MSQLDYNEQVLGFEGELYDMGPNDIVSYLAEEEIPHGYFVALGTNKSRQCILPAAAGDVTSDLAKLGFALREHSNQNKYQGVSADQGKYKVGSEVSIIKKGRVKVKCITAFAPTDSVFIGRGASEKGQLFNVTDTNRSALSGARFLNSGSAGEIAIVELF